MINRMASEAARTESDKMAELHRKEMQQAEAEAMITRDRERRETLGKKVEELQKEIAEIERRKKKLEVHETEARQKEEAQAIEERAAREVANIWSQYPLNPI